MQRVGLSKKRGLCQPLNPKPNARNKDPAKIKKGKGGGVTLGAGANQNPLNPNLQGPEVYINMISLLNLTYKS